MKEFGKISNKISILDFKLTQTSENDCNADQAGDFANPLKIMSDLMYKGFLFPWKIEKASSLKPGATYAITSTKTRNVIYYG